METIRCTAGRSGKKNKRSRENRNQKNHNNYQYAKAKSRRHKKELTRENRISVTLKGCDKFLETSKSAKRRCTGSNSKSHWWTMA